MALQATAFEEYRQAEARVAAFLIALQEEIKSLPDNPDIVRISDNCYAISSANLRIESWSPEHYEFKHQYKAIADVMSRSAKGKELSNVVDVLNAGIIKPSVGHMIRLHPNVISNVSDMLKTVGIL